MKIQRLSIDQALAYIALCWLAVNEMGGGVVSSASMGCAQHFGRQVTECMEPYWSVEAHFHSHRPSHSVSVPLAEHLCLQFETVLVCLHTALTKCPSHSNIKYVQSKLGSDWAVEIRNLCVSQSELTTNQVSGEDLADTKTLTEPSSKFLQDYQTDHDDVDEESFEDSGGADAKEEEIIVLVPEDEGKFYHDIVVSVRNKVKLQPRHDYYRSQRPLGISVFNIVSEGKHKPRASSAAVRITVPCLSSVLTVAVLVVSWFS